MMSALAIYTSRLSPGAGVQFSFSHGCSVGWTGLTADEACCVSSSG